MACHHAKTGYRHTAMVTLNLLAPPGMFGCKITSNIVVIVIACHFNVSTFQIQTFSAENFRYEFRHDHEFGVFSRATEPHITWRKIPADRR